MSVTKKFDCKVCGVEHTIIIDKDAGITINKTEDVNKNHSKNSDDKDGFINWLKGSGVWSNDFKENKEDD